MTDIERKALALLHECGWISDGYFDRVDGPWSKALCRAIEQHEAFRQEVSDAVVAAKAYYEVPMYDLSAFIIAKPDPLVEALNDLYPETSGNREYADNLRSALAARGLEIVEKK